MIIMKKYLFTILTLAFLISAITMPLNTLAYSESLNESSQETNNDSYQSFLQSYYERYQKYLALHQADNEAIIADYATINSEVVSNSVDIIEEDIDPILVAPTLFQIEDTETDSARIIKFGWNAVDGATSYQYQVSPYSDFSEITKDKTVDCTILTGAYETRNVFVYNGQAHRDYYVRVKAICDNIESEWSEVLFFPTADKDWCNLSLWSQLDVSSIDWSQIDSSSTSEEETEFAEP